MKKWIIPYIWSSGNTSLYHIRMAMHSYVTHIWSCENKSHGHIRMAPSHKLSFLGTSPGSFIPRMAIALIYDHVGTDPTVILEWLSTHIYHGRNQSSHHDRMAQPLHLTCSSEWLWFPALIFDMEGTNPLTVTEFLIPYIWPTRQNGYGTHHFPLEETSI